MAQSSRTFRLFVSSTFSDLKAERNALQERVFPRLRELAAAHGCRFQAIDLRWGVSEEAALDQQTMNICLGEIQRCQKTSPRPNFIILLGNRYGWRPLPAAIPTGEFELIFPFIPETDRDLILQWYRPDLNALSPVHLLQPRSGEQEDYERWGQMEARMHAVLESAARHARLGEADLAKYTASATEQEILHGAIQVVNARQHIFCFAREIDSIPSDGVGSDYIDLNQGKPDDTAAASLKDLKVRLKGVLGSNYHEYPSHWQDGKPSPDHIDRLVEDVYRELERVILQEIKSFEQVDPLEKEIAAHQAFAENRRRHFIGRELILKQVDGYLLSQNPSPLAIHGLPGSGKSALVAQALHLAEKSFPGANIIARFIAATPDSSSGRILLHGLCQQVTRLYGGDENTIPQDYRDLVQEFPSRLALAQPDKPLIIFLDALDQLSSTDNARGLAWLPRELPPHVHIVVSSLPGETLQNLAGRVPPDNQLSLAPMTLAEGDAVLETWLREAGRTLQPPQKESILAGFRQCALPLYLKLAFEEARHWKSYQIAAGLPADIPGMLSGLFQRLSDESNHGEKLVSHSLACLAEQCLAGRRLPPVTDGTPAAVQPAAKRPAGWASLTGLGDLVPV